LYREQPAPIDEGVDMSIIGKLRRPQDTRKRTSRELARALRTAPTRASREELLLLQNR
jgi:hypothetical protein